MIGLLKGGGGEGLWEDEVNGPVARLLTELLERQGTRACYTVALSVRWPEFNKFR